MYILIVAALTFVLPAASIIVDAAISHHATWGAAVIGRWFVFWAVGVRLFIAGLRQIIQPRYTAEIILGIKGGDSLIIVRELGFANVAMGSIGIATVLAPAWIPPAALAGGIFYGLAGLNHFAHERRNRLQNVAMTSDLFVASVLLTFCAASWLL